MTHDRREVLQHLLKGLRPRLQELSLQARRGGVADAKLSSVILLRRPGTGKGRDASLTVNLCTELGDSDAQIA